MRNHVPSLNALLKATSRSFYLTLRALPAAVRPQIGLAYLLARTTDTIADTELVALEIRLTALDALRRRIMGENSAPLAFGALAVHCALPAEKMLLERVEEPLRLLDQTPENDRARIREVLGTIISGQELDLKRFASASAQNLVALETEADLEDYTYRVAGCVGKFWTLLCRAHLFPKVPLDEDRLLRDGIRFGQGLQMVNILRDLPRDLRQGRCYLPREALETAGFKPEDLLEAAQAAQFRPLYEKWLTLAETQLKAGWDYTCLLPRGQMRLRLACAWPVLIGARTLAKLRIGNMLDASIRIKVSRAEVRSLMLRSIYLYPFAAAWRGQWVRACSPPSSCK